MCVVICFVGLCLFPRDFAKIFSELPWQSESRAISPGPPTYAHPMPGYQGYYPADEAPVSEHGSVLSTQTYNYKISVGSNDERFSYRWKMPVMDKSIVSRIRNFVRRMPCVRLCEDPQFSVVAFMLSSRAFFLPLVLSTPLIRWLCSQVQVPDFRSINVLMSFLSAGSFCVTEGPKGEEECVFHHPFDHVWAGGAPSWRSPRAVTLRAGATIGERVSFAQETEGWLASDELSYILSRIRQGVRNCHFTDLAIYLPHADEFAFETDRRHIPNTGKSYVPVLVGAHWMGLEFERDRTPVRVQLVQVPPAFEQRAIFLACKILQIPAHRLDVHTDPNHEIPHMCGWSLLARWIQDSQAQRVFGDLHRSLLLLPIDCRQIVTRMLEQCSLDWSRTGAGHDLQFVAYCLRGSFFTNMFHQQTSVHQSLDSGAAVAAGHPLSVFQPPVPVTITAGSSIG